MDADYEEGWRKMLKRNGLSTIELLVVIVIIVVLIGVLLPVISAARKRALQSACATNMSRIAAAIQAYARDNVGKVPPAQWYDPRNPVADYVNPPFAAPTTPPGRRRYYPELWQGRLRRYLRDNKTLICPATISKWSSGYFYHPIPKGQPISSDQYTTYGMNWRFSNGGALGGDPKNQSKPYIGIVQTLEAPPIPKRTVLLIETQQRLRWTGDSPAPWKGKPPTGGNVTPYGDWGEWFFAIRWLDNPAVPPGHIGGCNIMLADGHAGFVHTPKPPYPPMASSVETEGYKWW